MAKATSTIWPKPYLLECYERAIAEGCIELAFASHEQFKSFQAAFYRLRRKDDDQYKDFVKPSYHLCSCAWDSAKQVGYVIYDKLPAGANLPRISSVESTQMQGRTTPVAPPLPALEEPKEERVERPLDSMGLVEGLLKNISFKDEDDSPPSELG